MSVVIKNVAPGVTKPAAGPKAMKQNTAVGSGSRPTKGRTETMTSAPDQPRTLGRAPKGWLK